MDPIDLADKDITADALHTQRKFAQYLVEQRRAHYHFTVKANQPTLRADLTRFFQDRPAPDYLTCDPPEHGRIENRAVWTTVLLDAYLDFPHVAQAFAIERIVIDKKTDTVSHQNERLKAAFACPLHL